MTLDQLLNVGILLATLLPFTYILHIKNVRRSERQSFTLDDIAKRLKKHERRTKRLAVRILHIEARHNRNSTEDRIP